MQLNGKIRLAAFFVSSAFRSKQLDNSHIKKFSKTKNQAV
ncbi:hypothetical protein RV10_GL000387 [Enterococcus pallens]|nr:hypothetical protein RV10_GL000387 [Enterococcus pallens]